MRELSVFFKDKSIEYAELLKYGFVKNGNNYSFEKQIADCQFKVMIEISAEKQVSKVMDLVSEEEYALVDVADSTGDFVGKIKAEYEDILNDLIIKCTTPNVFKSDYAKIIIQYVKEKYGDELEYLWKKFPDNAVWRNQKNNKWFGALMVLSENKLGLHSDKTADIIDLRYQKDKIKEIIDGKAVFEGYHMNKNSWITVRLDGSVDLERIMKLIDNSYELSLQK